MNLKNQPPIFVPEQFLREVERMSKAALMDMVWDYVTQNASPGRPEIVEFRTRREIIETYRRRVKTKVLEAASTARGPEGP